MTSPHTPDTQPASDPVVAPRDTPDHHAPARVTALFIGIGLAWIWLTDHALTSISLQTGTGFWASAVKGSLFLSFATPVVYWLVRREFQLVTRAFALLQAVSEETSDAIFVKDRAGKYLLFNEAAARLVGKPVRTVLGRDDTALFEPASARAVMDRDRLVMEAGGATTEEETLSTGGVTRTYLATKAPYRDVGGKVIGIIGIARDITDQIRAREAMQESEERFRATFEQVAIGVAHAALDGRFLWVNQWYADITGYTREELLDHSVRSITHPDDRARDTEQVARLLAGDVATYTPVKRFVRKDGTVVWVQVNVSVRRSPDGYPLHLIGVAKDVTERLRAEAELRAERDRFEKTVETAPVVICSFQQRTDGSVCFPYASRRIRDIYGLGPDELASDATSIFALFHPDDVAQVKASIDESAHALTVWHGEFRVRHPSRGEIWVEGRAAPVRQEDGSTVWHGFIADVTDRKRASAFLARQSAVLERIAVNAPLPETLSELVRTVEEQFTGVVGSILLLDGDGRRLRLGAAPNLPTDYNAAIDGVVIGSRVGSCGTAAYTRLPVIVEDIATDPLWADFRELALAHGLRACWSTPIFAAAKDATSPTVLGTFAMYSRVTQTPPTRFVEVIVRAGHIASVAIESNRASRELRASEDRFRTFVDHATDAFFLHDSDGTVIDVNAQACASLGLSREELIGLRPHAFDPTVTPEGLTTLHGRLEAGETITFDTRHRRADGVEFPVEVRLRPFWAEGKRYGLALARDFTERRRVEEALRDRERFLSLVTGTARVGLVVVSERYEYLFANEAYGAVLGLDVSQIVGRYVPELLPDGWAQIQQRLDLALAGERVTYELNLPPSRWYRVWYEPRPDLAGRPTVVVVVVDITEQKRGELAIRESEARVRAVLHSLTEGVVFLDPTGRVVDANDSVAQVLGRTNQVLTDPDQDPRHRMIRADGTKFPPDEQPAMVALRTGQRIRDVEMGLRMSDESVTWLSVNAQPLYSGDGLLLGAVASFFDVTERRNAEETRARLAAIVESSDDAICSKSLDGVIQTWNVGAERLFGYSAKEIVGRSVTVLFPPNRLREEDGILARLLRGERVEQFDTVRVAKDGRRIDVSLAISPIRDAGGRVVGASKIVRDITERVRAAEALCRSEAQARRGAALISAVMDALPVSVIIADHEGRLVRMNPASTRIWGEARMSDSVEGYREYVGYWPGTGQRIQPREWPLARAVRNGETTNAVWVVIERFGDGARRHLELTAAPVIGDGGEQLGGVVVCQDVTEQVEAEAALRESETRFRTLVEHLPDGIFLQHGGLLFFCNPACVRLLGADDPGQLIGKSLFELLPPEDHEAVRQRVTHMDSTGQPVPPGPAVHPSRRGDHLGVRHRQPYPRRRSDCISRSSSRLDRAPANGGPAPPSRPDDPGGW